MTARIWKLLILTGAGIAVAFAVHAFRADPAQAPEELPGLLNEQPTAAAPAIHPTPPPHPVRIADDELHERLQASIDAILALEARVARLEAGHSARTDTEAQRSGEAAPQRSEDAARKRVAADAKSRELERARFASIAQRVMEEPVDATWALHASNVISNAFATQTAFEAQLGEVDCRSTLCRVQIRVDPAVADSELLMAFPPQARSTFPRLAIESSTHDSAHRTLYLGAQQHSLRGE